MDINKLMDKIKKYFKKDKLIAELYLENYEEFNIYFRIDYIKKHKTYKLSWFDLNLMDSYEIDKYISQEYIPEPIIKHIIEFYSNLTLENKNYFEEEFIKDKVYLKVNTKTKTNEYFETTFYKYIPFEIKEVSDIISIILNTAPRKLQEFLFQLHAKLNGEETKYNYKTKIIFDLYKGDIDSLFQLQIKPKGEIYYNEGKVLFLEKIDSRYFSIVAGNQNIYLNIIDYDEEKKEMSVHCSCPCDFYCKHLYASLKAIQNKKYNKFFKIRHIDTNQNMLVKYMTYDFVMCIGTVDKNLLIVNNRGGLETVTLLNEEGKLQWEIVEDNDRHELENKINELIN